MISVEFGREFHGVLFDVLDVSASGHLMITGGFFLEKYGDSGNNARVATGCPRFFW